MKLFVYIGSVWMKKLHFKMHSSDTSQRILYIQSLMKKCKIKLFYSSVNNKYSSFRQAHFSDKNKPNFPKEFFFLGGGSCPYPCHDATVSWRVYCNLITRNTRYPGTRSNTRRVPGYKNTRKSEH